MKTISYIVLVIGVMAVVLILGFGSDLLGPFGSMIMMVIALILFVVIGQRSGMGARGKTPGVMEENKWVYAQPLAGENWLELVVSHQEMTRHITLEIDRSRRFDRTFTIVVIAPDLNDLHENGVNPSSESEFNAVRLFVQEVVVRQLRTTDVISNSVSPSVTISLLPETDGEGANIAVARIREALAAAKMSIGQAAQSELKVSVMAVSYPADVRDTVGFIESIKEFEDRVSNVDSSG